MSTDIEAITETLAAYFHGFYESDAESLKRAFHPDASLYGLHKGKPVRLSIDRWLAMIETDVPVPASVPREEAQILTISHQGQGTAFALVHVANAEAHFHDLLSMVCVDGAWKIVAKTFATV